jgi:hypothetical protein
MHNNVPLLVAQQTDLVLKMLKKIGQMRNQKRKGSTGIQLLYGTRGTGTVLTKLRYQYRTGTDTVTVEITGTSFGSAVKFHFG